MTKKQYVIIRILLYAVLHTLDKTKHLPILSPATLFSTHVTVSWIKSDQIKTRCIQFGLYLRVYLGYICILEELEIK